LQVGARGTKLQGKKQFGKENKNAYGGSVRKTKDTPPCNMSRGGSLKADAIPTSQTILEPKRSKPAGHKFRLSLLEKKLESIIVSTVGGRGSWWKKAGLPKRGEDGMVRLREDWRKRKGGLLRKGEEG